jgi:DNA/RNA endonuclease YhcR with UshA esterase domain
MARLLALLALAGSARRQARCRRTTRSRCSSTTRRTIEITGNVTEFQVLESPRIISLDVKNKAGMIEEWKAETNAVTLLNYGGAGPKDSLKPGEQVTVDGWPSRDGANYMRMRTIKRADGTVLGTPVRNQRAD